MTEIRSELVAPRMISLYGVFGAFRIGKSPLTIRYMSTFANPTCAGGHAELVDQLKPMRERVEASTLKDLRSLLQRDLNDQRVAADLIPYLQGITYPQIGFFPAILAAIVPKGYLRATHGGPQYPRPKPVENSSSVDYEGYWSVHPYTVSGKEVPVGIFKIVENKSEIIVLDGQHRATAFRFVSGAFQPDKTIYQTFYRHAEVTEPPNADLPVTLIWFETAPDRKIQPVDVYRKLFVDVNKNQSVIGRVRTLLLDDTRATCIAMQVCYDAASKRGYRPDAFSLLHNVFDMDSDLAKGIVPSFALTTPEITEAALQFAFFGSPEYSPLTRWNVGRLRSQTHLDRFNGIFDSFPGTESLKDEEEGAVIRIPDCARADVFRQRLPTEYLPVLQSLFESLALLAPHYQACKETAKWVGGETINLEVWDRVFCGGEGLYWTLHSAGDDPRALKYKQAIKAVEGHFCEDRAKRFGLGLKAVNDVFGSFVTKAFQTGYLMAVDYLATEGDGNRLAQVDPLLNKLNQYTLIQWHAVFAQFRPLLLAKSETNSRVWPMYRNILLRMFDDGNCDIYSNGNLNKSPDWRAYEQSLAQVQESMLEVYPEKPEDEVLQDKAAELAEMVHAALVACGLTPLLPDIDELTKMAASSLANAFV